MKLHTTGQATTLRALDVQRTVRWLPLDDAFYLLAEVMTSTRAAPLVVTQEALLQVESHADSAVGTAASGVLCGAHYRDPTSGVDYLLVEEAERTIRMDIEGHPYASLAADLSRTMARVERDGRCVVGWYRFDVPLGQRVPAPDVGIHRALFPEPWQVALLRDGREGEGSGVFVRVEPNEGRAFSIPFLELVPRKRSRGRGPKMTSVRWRNYSAESTVAMLPQAEFRDKYTRAVSDPEANGSPRVGFFTGILERWSSRSEPLKLELRTSKPKQAEWPGPEAQRPEPQRAELRWAEAQPVEVQPAELWQPVPVAMEEPREAERREAERREAEPRPVEPRPAEPRPAEPRPAEPRPAEPRPAEPREAEPREAEPREAEPREAEPVAMGDLQSPESVAMEEPQPLEPVTMEVPRQPEPVAMEASRQPEPVATGEPRQPEPVATEEPQPLEAREPETPQSEPVAMDEQPEPEQTQPEQPQPEQPQLPEPVAMEEPRREHLAVSNDSQTHEPPTESWTERAAAWSIEPPVLPPDYVVRGEVNEEPPEWNWWDDALPLVAPRDVEPAGTAFDDASAPGVAREVEAVFAEWRPEPGEHIVDKPFSDPRRWPVSGTLIKGAMGLAALLLVAFFITRSLRSLHDMRSVSAAGEIAANQLDPQETDGGQATRALATPPAATGGSFTPEQRAQVRSALTRISKSRDDLAARLDTLNTTLLATRGVSRRAAACARADSLYRTSLLDRAKIDAARKELASVVGPVRMAGVDSLSRRANELQPILRSACQ